MSLMKYERAILSKIYNRVQNNGDIGILVTDVFMADHIRSLLEGTVTPARQAMADLAKAVYDPYHAAIGGRNFDIKEGTENVDSFNVEIVNLKGDLKMLGAKIMLLMPNTFAPVLKKLDLDNISVYTHGKQSEEIRSLEGLQLGVASVPEISTLVTEVDDMITKVNDAYIVKEEQFKSIKADRAKVLILKVAVAEILFKNFGTLTDNNFKTPFLTSQFFNLDIVDRDVKSPDSTLKNQYNISGVQGTFINAINVKFGFKDIMQAICKGPFGATIFLASEITDVIPLTAQKVNPGDKIIFDISSIGSSKQLYLMIVFDTMPSATEECQLKLTVDKG